MGRRWGILHIPTAKLCALWPHKGLLVYSTKISAEESILERETITEHEDCIELSSSSSIRFSAPGEHFTVVEID